MKQEVSFNQFQKTCPFHRMNEFSHKCFCQHSGGICNIDNCPDWKHKRRWETLEEEKWKVRDVESVEQSSMEEQTAPNADRKKRIR